MTIAPLTPGTDDLQRLSAAPAPGIARPLPTAAWPVITVGLVVMVGFFGGLGGWAATAPLASAVTASGTVTVTGQNKVVQHLDGGIVKEILVKDGDKVTAGQVLLRLDDTQARASVDLIRSQYLSLLALSARLIAERDEANEIKFPDPLLQAAAKPDVAEMMTGQVNLFEERRRTLDGEVAVLKQRVKQLSQQIAGAAVQQGAQDEQRRLIEDELASAQKLYDKGYVPKTRILELQRAAAALGGQSGEYSSNQAGIQQAIGEAKLQILQLRKERLAEVSQDLSDTQDKINAMLERLRSAEDVLSRVVIKAPVSGIVLNLAANTVGGVIASGSRILEIVPGDEPLVIDAAVRPEDIADIEVGMKTEVRLTAYNQRSTGPLHGKVIEVSADRVVTQADPRGHFEIKAVITDDLEKVPEIQIVPGMPAILSIPTRERTVLQYIIGPLTDYFSSGMREK